MRKSLSLSLLVLLLFILVSQRPALAFRHQILNEVLGVSTSSALPQIDSTVEGPGLILPDSPLFFIDQLKQNTRIFFAFSPEERARIRAQIAGERLAELRFMLAKNNQQAARAALQGVSDNLRGAAGELTKAQFAGKDVKALAKEINDSIKLKQKILDALEKDATGSFKSEVEVAQDAIFESKVEVEDALPEAELENEVKDDLARKIERRVNEASRSAVLIKRDIDELNKEASGSATRSIKRREEALRKAIEKSDEKLRKVQEKLLENEKKKQEKLLEVQKKAGEEAKDALEKAQKAAVGLEKARADIQKIRRTPVTDENASVPTSTPAPANNSSSGGSSSSNSGSGSSNSGSGSSNSGSSSGGSSSSGSSGGGESSGGGSHGGGSGKD